MNVKMFLRALVFLSLCFIALYIGMNNQHKIDFYFPILLERRITTQAALLFFAMFAIGVIAGMMLHSGGESKGGESSSSKRK